MRERAQASVETIALMAAAARARGSARCSASCASAPPLASALGAALSGVVAPGKATAPGLDGLERALLAGATSHRAGRPDAARPAHASPLATRPAAAQTQRSRPILRRSSHARSPDAAIDAEPDDIAVVDRATRGRMGARPPPSRAPAPRADLAIGFACVSGRLFSLAQRSRPDGRRARPTRSSRATPRATLVSLSHGLRDVVLRRPPGSGLAVVADGEAAARGGARG